MSYGGEKRVCTVPLANDDTAVLSTEFVPHPNAFNEIFGARINRPRALGILFAVVNPPAHGLHHERSRGAILGVRPGLGTCIGRPSDDWRICVWSNVVTGLGSCQT